MNPWAMLGLLIICVVAVTIWLRLWADIIAPARRTDELAGSFPRHDVIWCDELDTFVMFGDASDLPPARWYIFDGQDWLPSGP